MILIYVYGSGLGHLKRVSDFLYTKNINPENCVILTNSHYHQFWENSWQVIYQEDDVFKQKERFHTLFKKIVNDYLIDELIVDVFPLGFYGELADCLLMFKKKKTLLARILSKNYFTRYSSPFHYDAIYILEKGADLINYKGLKKIKIQLPYQFKEQKINDHYNYNYFLIIHSQPAVELDNLYKTAMMYRTHQKIIILTMVTLGSEYKQDHIIILNQKQVNKEQIDKADMIFSALGFNSLRLLNGWRQKWKPVPFPRTYDNQFDRKLVNNV